MGRLGESNGNENGWNDEIVHATSPNLRPISRALGVLKGRLRGSRMWRCCVLHSSEDIGCTG